MIFNESSDLKHPSTSPTVEDWLSQRLVTGMGFHLGTRSSPAKQILQITEAVKSFKMPGIRILFESYVDSMHAHDTQIATSSKFPRSGAALRNP